jgi:excinuclease UvrABC nuclease subunit
MVLDKNKIVIYVGQTTNLYARWSSGHHKLLDIIRECGSNAWIDWIEVPQERLNRVENALYDAYKPKLNSKTPPIL